MDGDSENLGMFCKESVFHSFLVSSICVMGYHANLLEMSRFYLANLCGHDIWPRTTYSINECSCSRNGRESTRNDKTECLLDRHLNR